MVNWLGNHSIRMVCGKCTSIRPGNPGAGPLVSNMKGAGTDGLTG